MSAKKAAAQEAVLDILRKTEGTKRRFLSPKEYYLLCEDVKANYVNLKMTDVAFAARATEVLGFVVKESHVAQARQIFDITSSKYAENGLDPALVKRIAALETVIAAWTPIIARLRELVEEPGK